MNSRKGKKKYIDNKRALEKADELAVLKAYNAVKCKGQKFTPAVEVFDKVESKTSNVGIQQMGAFLDALGNRLPKNFKFNREEANER